jgi:hypothetical protein
VTNGPDYASDFTTLVELLKIYEDEGYTGNFGAREEASVICFACHHLTPAREVSLEAMRRTEGASDPADMAVVAAITCPHCGQRGTLVMHYGAEATPEEDEVLRDLEDRRER